MTDVRSNLKFSAEEIQNAEREVFEDLEGFIDTKILITVLDIDLLPAVEKSSSSIEKLVTELGLHSENGGIFLNICLRYGYLTKSGDSYALGRHGAAVLEKYELFKSYAENRRAIYLDLVNLSELITTGHKGTAMVHMWPYFKQGEDPKTLSVQEVSSYSEHMASNSAFWVDHFLDAVDLSSCDSLLDGGGSTGTLAIKTAHRYPTMRTGIFDLPAVGELAKANIQDFGLNDRINFYPGDFFCDPMPDGFDVITFSRVCWDWPDKEANQLIRNAYAGLSSGGRVMVCERMYLDEEEDKRGAEMEMRLLTANGRMRSAQKYSSMFSDAGFSEITTVDTAFPSFRVICGKKN